MNRDPGRNALANAVAACRRILLGKGSEPGDLGVQLEAPFGFDPRTGVPRPIEQMSHLRSGQIGPARMLRAWHAHLCTAAAGKDGAERARAAYDQMRHELGYTALHRLCALRMAEERNIVSECVRKGLQSSGFRAWLQLAGPTLGPGEDAYAVFLDRLYDDLAVDLPAVFDRRAAASLVQPSPRAIQKLLEELDSPNLVDLWRDDTTLGWMFEDWNDADERTEMRKHDAPRNARELAVRNQFFTPRWVVEFLTENTLGRWWLERAGEGSVLSDTGRYRFLLPPTDRRAERPDPRDVRVLDPACGSGHFLLYAYDLLEAIYVEAWEGREHRSPNRRPLWEEWPERDAFLLEVPRLILEHNLYGVDIDPRCVQEGALALWLRAQKSWDAREVRPRQRPRVRQVHLVCAQALGGDPKAKAALLSGLKPAVLGRLVDALFAKAGEMGLLLRVDTALAETVAQVKKEYLAWDLEQRRLFRNGSSATGASGDFAALREMGDEAFWDEAETKLAEALAKVEEDAGEDRFGTRLFAEDVRHGLEFFDVARMRFDVVLMNPPFGDPSEPTKAALFAAYPDAGNDLYAMFYQRMLEMLDDGGSVGAITSRSWLGLPTMAGFRSHVLGHLGTVVAGVDLGYGVLNAKVETALTVMRQGSHPDYAAFWVRLVKTSRKAQTLQEAVQEGESHRSVSLAPSSRFETLPGKFYGYWMSDGLMAAYNSDQTLARAGVSARLGAEADSTGKEARYIRVAWEVRSEHISLTGRWIRFAKGGNFRRFYDDVNVAFRSLESTLKPSPWRRGKREWFGDAAVTWPLRNQNFGPRVLPKGCGFGHKGPAATAGPVPLASLLGMLTSSPVSLLLSSRLGIADDDPKAISPAFEVNLIRGLPWPELDPEVVARLAALASDAVELVRVGQIEDDDTGETVVAFAVPPVLVPPPNGKRATSLAAAVRARVAAREERVARLAAIQAEIDELVAKGYGFTERDRQVMDEELEPPLSRLPGCYPIDAELFTQAYLTKDPLDGEQLPGGLDAETDVRVEHRRGKQAYLRDEAALCRIFQAPPVRIAAVRQELGLLRDSDRARAAADVVSWAVGVAFGRFDVRLCKDTALIPTFRNAFAPLPACPLGQLVGPDGLPATPDKVTSEAWLAARAALPVPELPPAADFPAVTARDYPLDVAWDGILVEDAFLPDTRTAFTDRVSRVLAHVFGSAHSRWEEEIATALDTADIATWLRAPGGFFDNHLGRYTKSRRSAPLYWPLTFGSVTYWVYAPRLDERTVPGLLVRLRESIDRLRERRDRLASEAAADAAKQTDVARLRTEIGEREGMHARLSKLLADGYRPHPDDGFVVTAAPLHFAFRLPRWRDLLQGTWDELAAGGLDWAHLAMALWPARVREKCVGLDLKSEPPKIPARSLALAHGLEAEYDAVMTVAPPKAKAGKKAMKPAGEAPADVPTKRGRKKADAPAPPAEIASDSPTTGVQTTFPGMALKDPP